MKEIINTTARTASTIAAEIRTLDTQGKHICLLYIFEIGKRLEEAKSLVAHGEWGEYLETEVSYSQDTANRYMKVYREYNVNGVFPNSDTFLNLDFSKAYKLLSIPAEEREEFAKQNDVAHKSVRELEQIIKERDAALRAQADAEAAAEIALAERRRAEQKLLDAQQRAAAAKSSEGAWQQEIDKLNAALNKATAAEQQAKKKLKELKDNPKVPDAVMDKIRAESEAQAAEKAEKEYQGKLAEAQSQLDAATAAKDAAEKAAQEATEKLIVAQRAAQLSDPDAAAFNILYTQIQQDFHMLNGYRLKVTASNPELGRKMLTAIETMLAEMRKGVE